MINWAYFGSWSNIELDVLLPKEITIDTLIDLYAKGNYLIGWQHEEIGLQKILHWGQLNDKRTSTIIPSCVDC